MGADLLPRVQGGELRPPDDVELLLCTQHADPGDGGEGGAPVQDLPGDGGENSSEWYHDQKKLKTKVK